MVSEHGQLSSSHMSPEALKKLDHDRFLSQMTFAFGENCACDECGDIGEAAPKSITDAVKEHKRMKMMLEKNPEQTRSLVCRKGGVSIWKWEMPEDAEPIVEYGNSHRILLVHKLSEDMIIRSVGNGIIGSSQEEKDRTVVAWEENEAYFLPSNGGKALGWKCGNSVKSKSKEESKENGVKNVAIVYMLKSTTQSLEVDISSTDSTSSNLLSWDQQILGILRKLIHNTNQNKSEENNSQKQKEKLSRQGYLLPAGHFEVLKKILHEVESTQ